MGSSSNSSRCAARAPGRNGHISGAETALRRLGRNEQAVADYSEAIKLNPKNAETYNNRANAYSLLGRYDDAVKDYDEAIKLDAKNARMYANRGAIKLRQRKTEEARKDFAHAIQLDPSLKPKIEPLMKLEAAPNQR